MANNYILLNDGTSKILLNDGTSKILLNTEAPYSLVVDAGSYSLVGTAASLKPILTAGVGSYSLTGTTAALKYGRKVVADISSYSVTGSPAGLAHGYPIVAGVGSYAVVGTDAGLRQTHLLVAGTSSYSLSGQTVTFKTARKLIPDSGVYALTGTGATLTYVPAGGTVDNRKGYADLRTQARPITKVYKAGKQYRDWRKAVERELEAFNATTETPIDIEQPEIIDELVVEVKARLPDITRPPRPNEIKPGRRQDDRIIQTIEQAILTYAARREAEQLQQLAMVQRLEDEAIAILLLT